MNPAQMLKAVEDPEQVCEVPTTGASLWGVNDFAKSAGMTILACIQKKTCPICGSKGDTEHYYGDNPASYFFCSKSKTHIFEFDDETADRIQS